jgi:hydroxymethylpyrimidine kinase / phosphomethylpyrimidine kinase / thiamine-phosphate diphosphorylase
MNKRRMDMTYLLTIAGHDPTHGAGITADLATWAAMGCDGASVISALTVQNSHGLQEVQPVAAKLVQKALQAVLQEGEPQAIKLGMLASHDVVREVLEFLAERCGTVVFDPVLAGSNGLSAFESSPAAAQALLALLGRSHIITPNRLEAAQLLYKPSIKAADEAADLQALHRLCRQAVVLKGGHANGQHSTDLITDGQRIARLTTERLAASVHGTGCVFSAALAAGMAQGWDVFDAAAQAKVRVQAGLAQARLRPGRPQMNTAPIVSSEHLAWLRWGIPEHKADFEKSLEPLRRPKPFAPLTGALGFYPVVPSAKWVEQVLSWGVRTVQLRIKAGHLAAPELQAEIAKAVQAGHQYPGAQVFINDHWQAALNAGAYGVHLGQEDLAAAPLIELQSKGLRLGVSSHTPAEIAAAHAAQPSYIAIGPIYPTTLKAMQYEIVGLEQLARWTRWCQPRYPVVAIGGISLERAPGVLACAVNSLAVVSAVTAAHQPEQSVKAFLKLFENN